MYCLASNKRTGAAVQGVALLPMMALPRDFRFISPGGTAERVAPCVPLQPAEPRAYGVQRRLRKNKEGAAILPAEDDIERTLRYRDRIDRFSRRVVYEHLPGGQIDIPRAILGETFSALLRKYLEAGKSPIRIHAAAVSPLFRFVGDIEWLPWNGDRQAKRLQDIAELISEICRPLHKCIVARNENAAIRRDILIGHPRRYNLGEELLQRSVFVSLGR